MNPADARCPAWTIFNDCTSYSNFTAAAAALIPSDGGAGDLFSVLAARTLLIEICMKLMDEGLTSSQVLAENLMTADLKLVYKHLSNTVADPITVPEAVKMAESIRAVFNTNAHILRFLPDEGEEYSIKAWMTAEKERGLILFITSNYTDLEMNRTLLTLRFNLAIHSLMMMRKIRSLRIWFLFDELGASHRLPTIESGLQTARNFGGAMVFELHSFDKLVQVYGEENARNLSSLARTSLSSRQPISTPPSRVLATSAIARSGRWMPIIGYLAWIRDLSPPDWSIFREKFSFRFGRCRTRELELQLRNKTPKRKVKAKLRDDRTPATAPNECWSMDFLSDQLFDGSKIRVLSIVDNFTRVSPALDVRTSYRGSDVVDTLDRIALAHGRPRVRTR